MPKDLARTDPEARRRLERLALSVGPDVVTEVGKAALAAGADAVVSARLVARLMARHGLRDAVELAVLALPAARTMARPPISGFVVGAVGLEAGSGDLLLGGNLEFPGTQPWTTVHGEGFVMIRAIGRGRSLTAVAIGQARPCAHCRQTLTELAGAPDIVVADPAGRRLRLADLYPWPFAPADLGRVGIEAGAVPFPDLRLAAGDARTMPPVVAALLVERGRRAHAPYSGGPAAAVVLHRDGALAAGAVIENVAFNPTIGPLQAAVVELVALGREPAGIRAAWLAQAADASTRSDHAPGSREILAAVAPGTPLTVVSWA